MLRVPAAVPSVTQSCSVPRRGSAKNDNDIENSSNFEVLFEDLFEGWGVFCFEQVGELSRRCPHAVERRDLKCWWSAQMLAAPDKTCARALIGPARRRGVDGGAADVPVMHRG